MSELDVLWVKTCLALILANIVRGTFWRVAWSVLALGYGLLVLAQLWIEHREKQRR